MSEGGSQRYDPRKKERRTPTAFSSKSLHQSRNGGFSRHRPSHAESKHVSQRSSEGKRSQVLTPRQDDMRQKNEPAARSRPENPGGNRQRSRSPRRGTRDTKFPEEPYSSRDARTNEMRTTRPHVDEVPRDNRGRQTWKDHPKSSRDISPARTSPPSRTTSTHRQQRPADSQPMRSASTHQQRAPVNQPARSASHHHQPSSRSPVDQPSRSAVSDMHHSSSDGQFRDNPPSSGRSASVPESRHGVTSHRDDSRPSLRDMQPEHGEQAKRIPSQREVTRYREEDSPPRDIYSERRNEARYTSPIVLPGQGQRYESRVMDKYSDPGQQRDKYSDPGQQRDLSPDYRNSSNVPMSRESFAPKTTLDARFGGTGRRFALEDNITIGIMRSSQLPPDEPMNIRYAFNPDTFQMIHLRRDRTKPIFAREEILQFNHDANLDDDPDFQERRVIKVTPAAGQRTRLFPVQLEDDGEFRQPIKPEQVVNIRMSQDRGYDDRHGPTGRGSHQQNEQRAEISVQKQYMPEDKWMSPPTGGRGYEVER